MSRHIIVIPNLYIQDKELPPFSLPTLSYAGI